MSRPQTCPSLHNDPAILADWLERRTGGRVSAIKLVMKLAVFYGGDDETEASAASHPAEQPRKAGQDPR